MKTTSLTNISFQLSLCALIAALTGCASSSDHSSASASSTATTASASTSVSTSTSASASVSVGSGYKASDGRSISIGSNSRSSGGRTFKEPHMDKCWVADGFDFNGYDTIYIAPVISTAKPHDDEIPIQQIAEQNLRNELKQMIEAKGIFGKVVTEESAIKPGSKTLRLNNTIVEYSKGGGAARYFVGLYGGGQPNLKVQGVLLDNDKSVFTYTIRRSGVSAGARMGGAAMRDEDIQLQDIRSMVLDLTDFMAAISGKYKAN